MSILSLVNAACTRLIESGIRPEEAGLDAEVLGRDQAGVGQEAAHELVSR